MRVNIELPTLHGDQRAAYMQAGRFRAIRCGRRWGKTMFAEVIGSTFAIRKERIGWFTPDYRKASEAYLDMQYILQPVTSRARNTTFIKTITNGGLEFWSLENPSSGRSRKYHKIIIDEAAFGKDNLMDTWLRSLQPTLLDYQGMAIVLSNTNGIDENNFFYQICMDAKDGREQGLPAGPKYGFVEYHAPSWNNPTIPARLLNETQEAWEIRRDQIFAELRAKTHPLVFKQEYEAEFVDWSGVAFFAIDNLLVDINGHLQPLPEPVRLNVVFAVIDTSLKTGKANDGTAVTFYGYSKQSPYRLQILDWDLRQIEGASLAEWLPAVYLRLEELAKNSRAILGSIGVWIEDKGSGTVLLQHCSRKGWQANPIDIKLTDLGKDERALSVSGYVYQGLCKITHHAYTKVTNYKGVTRNHLLAQVSGFRVGDKEASKREDDLLDTFCYGNALALGDKYGF